MGNSELNTKGIIDSIDSFNENTEKICNSLNSLEGSLNGFNESISKLDQLKEIDLTKKKIDQLKDYKQKVNQAIDGLQTIDQDLSKIDELIETISKFAEEIHSVMKKSNTINFNTVSKNVRDLDKKITAFNKRIDTFIETELLRKMDTQYENMVEHFDNAIEKQQKIIDSMQEKIEQISSQNSQIKLNSQVRIKPMKSIDTSNLDFRGNDLFSDFGNMQEMMASFVEDVIDAYKDNENSKANIYQGFSEKVLKVLSEEGELEASYILGERYYEAGQIDEAVVEYEKLADAGDDRCKDKLIKIYKEKVEEEDPLYQERLGFELYRGKIIEKDIDKAIELLEKAEKNGSINSRKYLELIRLK